MTGRELIVYIMQNRLENESINKVIIGDRDNTTILSMEVGCKDWTPIEEYAAKCNVGIATVQAWVKLGLLCSIQINDTIYIPEWRNGRHE